MRQKLTMLRNYLLQFSLRLLTLLVTFAVYLTAPEALDFTKNRELLHPINLLWLVFFVSFAIQLAPFARISRGCLKQFPMHYEKTPDPIDAAALRRSTRALDRGAVRVALVWIALNGFFAALYFRRVIGIAELVLLAAFYYVCDLICIMFYCPFQHLLMKNKCCVTCRIFAWGTIMIATPFLFVPHLYSWSLAALALVCTLRWEITYRRHPERFTEQTNAFLRCENCTDHLCAMKKIHPHHKK